MTSVLGKSVGQIKFPYRQTDRWMDTHINHWDLLRPRSGMVGSVRQHAVGLFQTLILVLVQMTVHLLPLFSGEEMILRKPKSIHALVKELCYRQ